ncbi:penicillin-binding protein [Bacteroidia bacterium]|nr:penicillin-binding protein [Bacteroidia bacterium]
MTVEEKEYKSEEVIGRYSFIAFLVILFAVWIIGKACYISVAEGDYWRDLGEKQVADSVLVPAVRGNIYASNGELMAISEPQYRLYMDFWADGFADDSLKKYIKPLAVNLHNLLPHRSVAYYENHIMQGWKQQQGVKKGKRGIRKTREYALLDKDIDYGQWKRVKQMPFFNLGRGKTGLYSKVLKKRTNPYETLALRTIGSIYRESGKDGQIGKNGLELHYDSVLSGVSGLGTRQRVDGHLITLVEKKPVNGKDIVSTIDVHTQDITETALLKKLRELDAESGTAVVMETATGEIRAITNMGRLPDGTWGEVQNFAMNDQSEPGSTFKVVTMMVALEQEKIKPTDIVDLGVTGWTIPGTNDVIYDTRQKEITAEKTIRYSSNIGIAKLILKAYGKNPSQFVDGVYKIGFHRDMHLEIPGSGVPVIPHPKDKEHYWSNSTLATMSYGYATEVPPIYTLSFFNAIANNGRLMKPMFVREIQENGRTVEKKKPTILNGQICSEATLQQIRVMLDSVVNAPDGTGRDARSYKFSIAGKTGTARLAENGHYVPGEHQASFCGYFPSDNPQYSMIVVIRKPRTATAAGGLMCGKVFKTIAEEIYLRNIIPNKVALLKVKAHKGNPPVKRDLVARAPRVPNTVGMGAKDAVFSMESAGLQAVIVGKGVVVAQSIPAGGKIVKGQTVKLTLE